MARNSNSRITEIIPEVQPPITANGTYQFNGTVIILQNTGTADVVINDGFTMVQNQTLQLAVNQETYAIIPARFKMIFGSTGTRRVEVITMIPNDPDFNNYVQQ